MAKLSAIGLLIALVGFAIYLVFYNFNIPAIKPTPSPVSGPVTNEPASLGLELVSPDDNSLVFQPDIIVSGKVSTQSAILVSSEDSDVVIQSQEDGSFSTVFTLSSGINNIQVAVFDKNGEQRMINKTVYYSKEKI